MTDVHCHLAGADETVREFLIGREFQGVHPWDWPEWNAARREELRAALAADVRLGVGEIGLDRLKAREIPAGMRTAFAEQLELAAEFRRPVVLHGAKCWGQVVAESARFAGRIPALLFHGFSRSDGLLPEIVKLNGFVSVGPAVMNEHAVNYRALVKKLPRERLLLETDRTAESAASCPSVRALLALVAGLRGETAAELERVTDDNASRFWNAGEMV